MTLSSSNEEKAEKRSSHKSAKSTKIKKAVSKLPKRQGKSAPSISDTINLMIKKVRVAVKEYISKGENSSVMFKVSAVLLFLGSGMVFLRLLLSQHQLHEIKKYEEMLDAQKREEFDQLKSWAQRAGLVAICVLAALAYYVKQANIRKEAVKEDGKCCQIWVFSSLILLSLTLAALYLLRHRLFESLQPKPTSSLPAALLGDDTSSQPQGLMPLLAAAVLTGSLSLMARRLRDFGSPTAMSAATSWTPLPCVNVPDGGSGFRNYEIPCDKYTGDGPWEGNAKRARPRLEPRGKSNLFKNIPETMGLRWSRK